MSRDVYWINDPDERGHRDVGSGGPAVGRRRRSRRRRLWPWALAVLITLGAGGYLLRHSILVGVARFLDVTEPVESADYALVLSGVPSVRPFYAAALYRAGLAGAVLLTRPEPVSDSLDGIQPAEHELVPEILRHEGVFPIDIITIPGEMTSTLDEIRALKAFLAERPTARVTIVTSAFHTRRTRLIVRRTLDEAASRVRLLGVPSDSFRDDDWWLSKTGLTAVVGELLKLPYYRLVY